MSTFAKVKTEIKDLSMLQQSLTDLKMKYESNTKNVRFYGTSPRDLDVYVVGLNFGFVRDEKTGSYDIVGDSDFKKHFNKIRQKYSENVTKDILVKQGYTISDIRVQKDGKLKIVAKRLAYA